LAPQTALLWQQFVNDNDVNVVVTTWLQVLDQISLERASMKWFSAGTSVSTEVVIM
jgi:hypothetical protein